MYFYNESFVFSLHSLHKYNKVIFEKFSKLVNLKKLLCKQCLKVSSPSSQVCQPAPSGVTSPHTVPFLLRWVSAPSPVNYLLRPSITSLRTIASTFHRALS